MNSLRLFTILGLLVVAHLSAQPMTNAPDVPDQLDLESAIRYAVENNYSIRQAQERIREQEGLIVEVKAQALPSVSLGSSYTRQADGLVQSNGSFTPSDQNWNIALTVRQTLYSGGGVRAALDAQQLVRETALLDLQTVINNALLQVRTRFYDVLLAREQTSVQEQNIQLLKQQLGDTQSRFTAGGVSNFEVLRAEVALANAQPALIRARNGYRISIDELRQAIGYDNRNRRNLHRIPDFVGSLDTVPVNYDLQTALDAAWRNRPELLRLEKLEEAREAGVKVAKSDFLPSVDLVGGYQVNKSYTSEDFGDSLKGWVVGIESNWAIWDGNRTNGRVRQARSQLTQAQLTRQEAQLNVEVEVRRALSSLQEAQELVGAAGKVVAQAEEAVRLADARNSAGSATQLDVLTAQVALTDARNNQLQANYSFNVALATLRTAMGEADPLVMP